MWVSFCNRHNPQNIGVIGHIALICIDGEMSFYPQLFCVEILDKIFVNRQICKCFLRLLNIWECNYIYPYMWGFLKGNKLTVL